MTRRRVADGMVWGDLWQGGAEDVALVSEERSGVWTREDGGGFRRSGDIQQADASGLLIFMIPGALGLFDYDADGDLDLYYAVERRDRFFCSGQPCLPDADYVMRQVVGLRPGFEPLALPEQNNPLARPAFASFRTWRDTKRSAGGLAFGDYDDDGDLDVFVNNFGSGDPVRGVPPAYAGHNLLWRNDGEGAFTDVAVELGVHASPRDRWGDEEPVIAMVQTGGRDVIDYPRPVGGDGRGCVFADVDNDGDLDLLLPKAPGRVFENRAADRHNSLQLRLYRFGRRSAVGARVVAQAGARTLRRDVTVAHGPEQPQGSGWLHLGLRGRSGLEALNVRWPDGEVQELEPVRANQNLIVEQGRGVLAL